MACVEHEENDNELIDALKEDGTFTVDGQVQSDINDAVDNVAGGNIDDSLDDSDAE